jgi:hypothetical protein
MIDIETLGTKPGSVIYQIAAVEFCPDTFVTGRDIEMHIDPASCARIGLTKDEATVEWHKENGHALPRIAGRHKDVLHIRAALTDLSIFIAGIEPDQVWCRGVSFDFPMLEAAYTAAHMGISIPWKYYQQYDLRTIWNLAFPDDRPEDVAHTALADCYAQIEQLAAANDRIIDLCTKATPRETFGTPSYSDKPEEVTITGHIINTKNGTMTPVTLSGIGA